MSFNGEDAIRVAITLFIVVSIGGAMLAGPLATTSDGGGDTAYRTLEVADGSSTIQTGLTSEVVDVLEVQATLGDAVELTGANDSQATVDADLSGAGSAWSVSAVATGDGVTTNRTVVGASLPEHQVVIWYDATADQYHGWVYNESTASAREVTISANGTVNQTTVLSVERLDNGTLRLARNTTVATVSAGNGSTSTTPPTANWDGTVDELRVRDPLSDTQRQALVDEPATAVPGGEPVAIAKFDSRSQASTLPVYWSAGEVTLQNASLVDGVAGPSLAEETDYEVDDDRVSVVNGGALETSGEVLFVEIELDALTLLPLIKMMIALFMLGVVAIPVAKAAQEL